MAEHVDVITAPDKELFRYCLYQPTVTVAAGEYAQQLVQSFWRRGNRSRLEHRKMRMHYRISVKSVVAAGAVQKLEGVCSSMFKRRPAV